MTSVCNVPGVSGGQVADIVIGVLVGVTLLTLVVLVVWRYRDDVRQLLDQLPRPWHLRDNQQFHVTRSQRLRRAVAERREHDKRGVTRGAPTAARQRATHEGAENGQR